MAKNENAAARGRRSVRTTARASATPRPAVRRGTPPPKPKSKAVKRPPRPTAAAATPAATIAAAAEAAAAAAATAKELRYLQARRVEDIAQAFVSLSSELWIVKDRMAVLEQVLERHGIPAPAAVDAYVPEGAFKAGLDAERRAWAQRMMAALFPRGLPKVD